MTDTKQLIAGLEAADGPSAELFLRAYIAIFGVPQAEPEYRPFDRFRVLVDNSAWLCAAMMLVPEGWRVRDMGDWEDRWLLALVHESTGVRVEARAGRGDPAIALCIAALKAREE